MPGDHGQMYLLFGILRDMELDVVGLLETDLHVGVIYPFYPVSTHVALS